MKLDNIKLEIVKYDVSLLLNHKRLIKYVAQLRFDEFNYLYPNLKLNDVVQKLKDQGNNNGLPCTWVVLKDIEFMGTFSLTLSDLSSHSHLTPWLAGVVVPYSKRRQGIGTFMIKQAEKLAKEMHYRVLYLFTPNKASWYRKLGWNVIEQTSCNNVPITIMNKYLS
jgi:predicted N-acetyltransferase YhbS